MCKTALQMAKPCWRLSWLVPNSLTAALQSPPSSCHRFARSLPCQLPSAAAQRAEWVSAQSLRLCQPERPLRRFHSAPFIRGLSLSEEDQILGHRLILPRGPSILETQFPWLNSWNCQSSDHGRLRRLHQHRHLLTMHPSAGVQLGRLSFLC